MRSYCILVYLSWSKPSFIFRLSPLFRRIKTQSVFYALQALPVKVYTNPKAKKYNVTRREKKNKNPQGKKPPALAFHGGKRYTMHCRLRDEDWVLCDPPV